MTLDLRRLVEQATRSRRQTLGGLDLDLDPILASIALATVSLACRKSYWVAATAMGGERNVPGCCELQQQHHHHHDYIVSVLASRSLGIVSYRSGTFPSPNSRFAKETRLVAHLRYLPKCNLLVVDRPVQPVRRRRLQNLAEGHVARQTPIVHKEELIYRFGGKALLLHLQVRIVFVHGPRNFFLVAKRALNGSPRACQRTWFD